MARRLLHQQQVAAVSYQATTSNLSLAGAHLVMNCSEQQLHRSIEEEATLQQPHHRSIVVAAASLQQQHHHSIAAAVKPIKKGKQKKESQPRGSCIQTDNYTKSGRLVKPSASKF